MDIPESEVTSKICILNFPEEFKEWINEALGPGGELVRVKDLDPEVDKDGIAIENYIIGIKQKEKA